MIDLDPYFKFKIGDTVRPKVHRPGYTRDGVRFTPQVMVVVERQLNQCYGGVQANYGCRTHTVGEGGLFTGGGGYSFIQALIPITEPELEAYELPPLTDEKPPRRPRVPEPTGDDNAAI